VNGRQVLVQGGAGGVGSFAVGFARRAGAQVIATVHSSADEAAARAAGAHHVVRTDGRAQTQVVAEVLRVAHEGVRHIVEVAFDTNIEMDERMLALGGSIAAYATNNPRPAIPFWELLSKTARVSLLASDDFPMDQKLAAAAEVNELLAAGWRGSRVDRIFPLDEIAAAHAYAESHPRGRVLLAL